MKKYIVIVVIGILFFGIAIYVISNSYDNMQANSIVFENDILKNISYENNRLRIDVDSTVKEYCIKTTKSRPDRNDICFNEINNTAYVSVYEYKNYYLWLIDDNGAVKDYGKISIKDIKK